MSTRPWGTLIQRELAKLAPLLLVGCATMASPETPPVAPAPPAPPASLPRAAPMPDPDGASLGVGPLVDVEETPSGEYMYATWDKVVPFGAGIMSFSGFEHEAYNLSIGDPKCAIAHPSPSDCTGVRVALWSDAARTKAWPRLDGKDGTDDYGPFVATTSLWSHFSPGKAGVYASRSHPDTSVLVVDFISETGGVTVFLEDASDRFQEAEIAEVRDGHVAVFREKNGGLVAGRITKEPSGKRRIELGKRLRIGDVQALDARSTDAREMREKEGRASFGPLRLVPLVDARGEPKHELAFVWTEALPPPPSHPREPPQKKARVLVPRTEKKSGTGAAKHQCGVVDQAPVRERWMSRRDLKDGDGCEGRRSRPLAHATVKKRLHLTRLTAVGAIADDHETDLVATFDASKADLSAYATLGGGVVVGNTEFDGGLRPLGKTVPSRQSFGSPEWAGPPPQALSGAAFDPVSGEVLLVYREATGNFIFWATSDQFRARRFNALGARLGGAIKMDRVVQETFNAPAYAAKLGEGWMTLRDGEFRVVGGPHHRAVHLLPGQDSGDDDAFCLEANVCSPDLKLEGLASRPGGVTEIFLRTKTTHYALAIEGKTLIGERRAPVTFPPDASPAVGPSGAVLGDDGTVLWWAFAPETGVSVVRGANERTAIPGWEPRKGVLSASLHLVWGDAVVIVEGPDTASATWLRAGKTVTIDRAALQAAPDHKNPMYAVLGPLLPSREWLLPATPGELLRAPVGLAAAAANCPVALATGPRRLLLACGEPASTQKPTPRAGVRIVRY